MIGAVPAPKAIIVSSPWTTLAVAAGERQEAVDQPAGQEARQDSREQDVGPAGRGQERSDERPRQAGRAAAGDRREEPARQDSQGQKPLEHEQDARDDGQPRLHVDQRAGSAGQPEAAIASDHSEERVGENPTERVSELTPEVRRPGSRRPRRCSGRSRRTCPRNAPSRAALPETPAAARSSRGGLQDHGNLGRRSCQRPSRRPAGESGTTAL